MNLFAILLFLFNRNYFYIFFSTAESKQHHLRHSPSLFLRGSPISIIFLLRLVPIFYDSIPFLLQLLLKLPTILPASLSLDRPKEGGAGRRRSFYVFLSPVYL